MAFVAAVCCLGLLSLSGVWSQARAARPRAPQLSAPRCQTDGSGETSVISFYGSGKLLSETDLPLCVTGRLTVTFAGDPAAGCAVHGLCGYAGTETWQPEGAGDVAISTFEQRGRRHTAVTMIVGGPANPLLSAVQRSQSAGTTTACSDTGQNGGEFFSLPVSGARVTIGLGRADNPLLGTRCAGPLEADVAAALPSRTLRLSHVLHGRATIDLAGSGRFAAHGLAGSVRSTIAIVLGRPDRSSGSGAGAPPSGVTPRRLVEVHYRVMHVGGTATVLVRSSALAAVCGPFDACGLEGAIAVAPGSAAGGSVFLTAIAPLRRPKRDLLTALGVGRRGNPSGIGVEGAGEASLRGEVTADLTQQDVCRDQVGLRQAAIELRQRADRLEISVSPAESQADDPLRTRCPGPELGSHQLTSASVPLSVLRHSSFSVALRGGSFSDGPYRVTTRSTLTITLRRARVTTQVVPFLARTG